MTPVLISVLTMLRGLLRTRAALHLEILALRHQRQVLQRSRPRRLHLANADRWLWVWLSAAWSGWRTALVIVKPETVIAWHRQGVRLFVLVILAHERRRVVHVAVPSTPPRRGRRSNSAKRFRGTRLHDIWSTIVIQPSPRGRQRRRRSAADCIIATNDVRPNRRR